MNKQLQARKQEVSEKVKEIKQRQKNWLKQREAAGKATETSSNNDVKKCSNRQKAENNPSPNASNSQAESSVQNIIAAKKSNAKFQNWLKAKDKDKDNHHDNHVYDSSNYGNSGSYGDYYGNSTYKDRPYKDYTGSDDVNILRVSSARSAQYATPDPGWSSDDSTGEITAAELMSPQDFETVADDIIAKVKGELHVTGTVDKPPANNDRNVKKRNTKANNHASKHGHGNGGNKGGARYRNDVRVTENESPEMSSHSCPVCRTLMLPPNHTAMLLIPCGHTLCLVCSGAIKFCHSCGSQIESLIPNAALQQVITDFSNKPKRRDSDDNHVSNRTRSYAEEYANLETRCDILRQEADTINDSIHGLTQKLGCDKQQVSNITLEEDCIQRQITELKEKKQFLAQHRFEYEKNCERLHKQTKQETKRLVLVGDTLKSLHGQMEKIKLLSESDD